MVEKIRNLGDLVKNATVDGIKFGAVTFPIYAGVMSEIQNTGFYESCGKNWPFLMGIALAQIGMKTARYFKDNYKRIEE